MVKELTTAWDLQREFQDMDRDYFSSYGYEALLDYYNQYDEDVKLDVVAICCEWSEYSDLELIEDYGYLIDDELEDEKIEKLIEELEYRTIVIPLANGNYLVAAF